MARRVAKQKRKALRQLWGDTHDFTQMFIDTFAKDDKIVCNLRKICGLMLLVGMIISGLPLVVYGLCDTHTPPTKESLHICDLVPTPDIKDYKSDNIVPVKVTPKERDIIARLVHTEAGNQPDSGQRAVAQVVLNRVNHPKYPSTITQVVYQRNQFQGVGNKKFHSTVPQRVLDNVDFILAGNKVLPDTVTNFKSIYCNVTWDLPFYAKIGDHNFYHSKPI